jgi:hypothetical protein
LDNESQKKVALLPILVLDSRSRFSDLSFHSQLWMEGSRRKFTALDYGQGRTPAEIEKDKSEVEKFLLNPEVG